MSGSKRRGSKTTAKRSTVKAPLPDRAAMEAHLAALGSDEVKVAIAKAQDVMYDAWDAASARSAVALARKALRLSPLCADAYNLLAAKAAPRQETLDLYMQGLEAGELALGADGFAEFEGRFWGYLETRPYMRARAGVALTLIEMGRGDEAIGHLQAMLRLNPNDNQGMRYVLLGCLLEGDDLRAAKALIADYEGEWSIWWNYGRALIAFREGGAATPEARALVASCLEANAHVVGILAGTEAAAVSVDPFVAVFSREEASDYLRRHGAAWRKTPGAIAWLVATAAGLVGA
jgi:tetratricopeptide (TPR) repeat protein